MQCTNLVVFVVCLFFNLHEQRYMSDKEVLYTVHHESRGKDKYVAVQLLLKDICVPNFVEKMNDPPWNIFCMSIICKSRCRKNYKFENFLPIKV